MRVSAKMRDESARRWRRLAPDQPVVDPMHLVRFHLLAESRVGLIMLGDQQQP